MLWLPLVKDEEPFIAPHDGPFALFMGFLT